MVKSGLTNLIYISFHTNWIVKYCSQIPNFDQRKLNPWVYLRIEHSFQRKMLKKIKRYFSFTLVMRLKKLISELERVAEFWMITLPILSHWISTSEDYLWKKGLRQTMFLVAGRKFLIFSRTKVQKCWCRTVRWEISARKYMGFN